MPLIMLDRDGVINKDRHPNGVTSLEQLDIYPFAARAIRQCNDAGFHVIIATNQSAIGKGLLSEEVLHAIHHRMREILYQQAGAVIDEIYYCPDHPDTPTHRRKPAPGMLTEALMQFGANAADTAFIGDALRDLQAAQQAGCRPVLVHTGKGEATARELSHHPLLAATSHYATLHDAVQAIIRRAPHVPA